MYISSNKKFSNVKFSNEKFVNSQIINVQMHIISFEIFLMYISSNEHFLNEKFSHVHSDMYIPMHTFSVCIVGLGFVKRTVSVILSDLSCKYDNDRFTTVPLNSLYFKDN